MAIVISLMMALVSYYKGDKIALSVSGAKPIKKEENPYVYRLVENLCIAAGLPAPKIYLIPDQAMNAFACGRDPRRSSIALTTGIVEKLENEELEGVISHELSHIKNFDIKLMTITAVLAGVIVLLSDWMMRSFLWGGNRRRGKEGGQIMAIFLIIGLILAILSPLIAQIIQLTISRKREFLADADAALLTRYPEGLARALEKISQSPPVQKASNATAHLYIASPFGKKKSWLTKLFSTHPPIEERVNALRKMIKN
ncbi:MAG: Uncharacterized protein Athens071412_417 [Parcubacteria group bacterium Athens0714_12]|nr:MAG: Uncharacterized protein Athens071412_417 [Parcubacteria group bacterium Athens0714_12]